MSIKPNDLGLISEVTLSQPKIQSIEKGGNLPSGAFYQYFYKLLDTDGRESIFSPGSVLIDVQEELSNDDTISYYELDSTEAGVADDKLFRIEIEDIDTDFDVIELYAVIWESLDSPTIYKVDDYSVTGSTMNFVHSSLDNNINIPVAQFMEIGIPFTAKTIEDRDKVLAAGNIKQTKFDLDFDARAYRFNSGGDFDLFDGAKNSTTFSTDYSGSFANIPEEADAINPTNYDNSLDIYGTNYSILNTANRQIYQSDGSTVGGEGTNVSYTFIANSRIGSTGSDALADDSPVDEGYNRTDERAAATTFSLGNTNLDGSAVQYDIEDEFTNTKSIKLNALVTGYARGEVYRFGIVFYSKAAFFRM